MLHVPLSTQMLSLCPNSRGIPTMRKSGDGQLAPVASPKGTAADVVGVQQVFVHCSLRGVCERVSLHLLEGDSCSCSNKSDWFLPRCMCLVDSHSA